MGNRISIAVLFGGRSGEHEVSLMSARSVLAVLDPKQYDVTQIAVTREGLWYTGENALNALETNSISKLHRVALFPEPQNGQLFIKKDFHWEPLVKADVFFPVLHGTFGEDGTLQGLFELADVAYVGCGVLSSSVGMDKSLFKDIMRQNQIPVPDYMLFTRYLINTQVNETINKIEKTLPYPVFVKPANLGSSVGISKCTNRSDLLEGLLDAARFDRRILVEKGINAREIEVSVLGNEDPVASVAGEIKPAEEFYTYSAKYLANNSELIIPAALNDDFSAQIRRMAIQAFKAIDGAGMARVDFLIDRETNELFISEVNTIPGFTSISMYPKLWDATGLPYSKLVDRLIELAMERKQVRDATEHSYRREE